MVFHCFLIFLQEKKTYYAGIMLDAPSIVLCSKLCRHNVSDPKPENSHLRPSKKKTCFSSPPASFFSAASLFLLFFMSNFFMRKSQQASLLPCT